MKICLGSFAPFVGGAEVSAERLAVALREAGHEVFLLLGQHGAVWDRMQRAGLKCRYAPMHLTDKRHWWRCLRSRATIRRVLDEERPDMLHSNDLPTHQVLSGAARGLSIPRICHHRFVYEGAVIDWLNKYGADRHLFVSRAFMDEMSASSERLRRSPRAVVYNGLPLPPMPSDAERQEARRRLKLPADRIVVTFAGQVIPIKGVADLLHAWSMLDPVLSHAACLIVVGDDLQNNGAYRAEMQALAGELNCPARFVGFQDNVGEWLLASDLAVVPSHIEPFGNAALEAMAYGLPVVACAVGGIPEIVVSDQTGLLVPPRAPDLLANALTRLLGEQESRRRFGLEGRRRCEELFSVNAHVRCVLEEYRQVMETASCS